MKNGSDLGLRLLRGEEAAIKAGLSKTRMYALIRGGKFPQPIRCDGIASRWSSEEVEAWVRDKIKNGARGINPDQIPRKRKGRKFVDCVEVA